MSTHLLHLTATDSPSVPTRVCALLAQRRIPVTSIHATRGMGNRWSVRLRLDLAEPQRLALVIEQLRRLVDVMKVVELVLPTSGDLRSPRLPAAVGR
jgi:acetolactate synthase small subunit